MENILNFRKLADGEVNNEGKQIKGIYRSADPSFASLLDKAELSKLGVKSIIDLRSEEEISEHPQISDENLTVKWVDIIGNGTQNKVEQFTAEELSKLMIELYRTLFVQTEGFKEEFKYIDSINGDGFLFHCTAGKDRTGITGIILMHILGFSKEQIINEYLTIDQRLVDSIFKRFSEKFSVENDEKAEALKRVATVKKEFVKAFYEGVEREYGSLDQYVLNKVDVSEEMQNKMKVNYLV